MRAALKALYRAIIDKQQPAPYSTEGKVRNVLVTFNSMSCPTAVPTGVGSGVQFAIRFDADT